MFASQEPPVRWASQLGFNGHGLFGRLPHVDLARVLRTVASAGMVGVEVMSDLAERPNVLAEAITEAGLTCSALHLFDHEIDDIRMEALWLERAQTLSTSTLIVSADATRWPSIDALVMRVAELTDVASGAGIEVAFHPHASEFAGGLVDLLAADDRALVLDLYWASVAGIPAAEALARWGAKAHHLHIKRGALTGNSVADQLLALEAVGCGAAWRVVESEAEVADPLALLRDAQLPREKATL